MEVSWHPSRSRNRCYLRKAFFFFETLFSEKNSFLEVQLVEVGSKNQSKIDVKNDAETERLGNSILIDLGAILRLQNRAKTLKNRC